MSRLLASMGLVRLGNSLAHSGRWTAVSIACFVIALLSGAEGMLARAVGHAASDAMRTVALAGTFLLSGLPQTVEALCIVGSGKVDTHVLMSLAVVGTVFMGMAQEVGGGASRRDRAGKLPLCLCQKACKTALAYASISAEERFGHTGAVVMCLPPSCASTPSPAASHVPLALPQGALLLLLFQVSHTLEELFSARARGSLERLFASIPTQVLLLFWVRASRPQVLRSCGVAWPERSGRWLFKAQETRCLLVPLQGCQDWGCLRPRARQGIIRLLLVCGFDCACSGLRVVLSGPQAALCRALCRPRSWRWTSPPAAHSCSRRRRRWQSLCGPGSTCSSSQGSRCCCSASAYSGVAQGMVTSTFL